MLAVAIATVLAATRESEESALPPRTNEFYGVTPQTPMDGEDFERLAAAGAGTVRLALDWSHIQQAPGRCRPVAGSACDWTATDSLVGNAAANGIRVIPIVGGTRAFGPGRSQAADARPPAQGEELAGFERFAAAAAARYGRGGTYWKDFREFTGDDGLPIQSWQIWNEPNAELYWPPRPEPSEYGKLVAAASAAIRSEDPEAEVVLAGLFGTSAVDSSDFLRALYRIDGLADAFDSIAIHPYSPDLHGIRVQVEWALEAAEEAGDEDVGLWVTELGWSSGDGHHPLELGPEGQAEMLTRSFRLLWRNRDQWHVRGVVWYTWRDLLEESVCEFCREAGLFDAEGEPKPAWDSFTEAVRR